jgi:hypothetical protein
MSSGKSYRLSRLNHRSCYVRLWSWSSWMIIFLYAWMISWYLCSVERPNLPINPKYFSIVHQGIQFYWSPMLTHHYHTHHVITAPSIRFSLCFPNIGSTAMDAQLMWLSALNSVFLLRWGIGFLDEGSTAYHFSIITCIAKFKISKRQNLPPTRKYFAPQGYETLRNSLSTPRQVGGWGVSL